MQCWINHSYIVDMLSKQDEAVTPSYVDDDDAEQIVTDIIQQEPVETTPQSKRLREHFSLQARSSRK
ncbi:hypothetical protein L2E82_47961 [Cichorium intybus]|uniref:Uncharacterized protein n=1 Tax=Cichorium intybus TaxID=13427 RepID=A0ACB8YY10_CICIN|nr:hypothetical protein L2E82_47961 [Cichorium intybus]